jgi:molybdopterin/thiamine biosynthesis adenylyltransferase
VSVDCPDWQGMRAQIQQIAKVDLLIDCVDTRKARRAIDKWALQSRVLYWLDLGNNASSGQFILGQPNNSVINGKGSAACQR